MYLDACGAILCYEHACTLQTPALDGLELGENVKQEQKLSISQFILNHQLVFDQFKNAEARG